MKNLLAQGGLFLWGASLVAILFVGLPPMTASQGMIFIGLMFACVLLFLANFQGIGSPRSDFPSSDQLFEVRGVGEYCDRKENEHVLVALKKPSGGDKIVTYKIPKYSVVPEQLKIGDIVAFQDGVLKKYREEYSPS